MKKAIIDIGSNSVRLGIFADGIVVFRQKITSQLSEGMSSENFLSIQAINRTADAVEWLVKIAEEHGVDKNQIYSFATAAVRNSKNGHVFVDRAKKLINRTIDVLSGETEGEISLLGALGGGDGATLDIGGASTELAIAKNREIIYSRSIKTGAVLLFDSCGNDRESLEIAIAQKLNEFDRLYVAELTAVGGTACACAILIMRQKYGEAENLSGYFSKASLEILVDKLFLLGEAERIILLNQDYKRAKIICGGALLLLRILDRFSVDGLRYSESDNLEGYYAYLEGKRYEKKWG